MSYVFQVPTYEINALASRDRERVDLAPDRKCDCFRGGGAYRARRQLRQQGPFPTDLLPSYQGLSLLLLEAYFFHVRSLPSLLCSKKRGQPPGESDVHGPGE
ncbi:hypothetical protein TIFTF001_026292 [Ficus carica]|uniref:Uncharacterized protein n=1 Tax=Ficus carica TaxID=3494 RepID=A0AA88IY11_FICCA|nr:hypothetical protein TIFTF001_026292 [Ficus carica]